MTVTVGHHPPRCAEEPEFYVKSPTEFIERQPYRDREGAVCHKATGRFLTVAVLLARMIATESSCLPLETVA